MSSHSLAGEKRLTQGESLGEGSRKQKKVDHGWCQYRISQNQKINMDPGMGCRPNSAGQSPGSPWKDVSCYGAVAMVWCQADILMLLLKRKNCKHCGPNQRVPSNCGQKEVCVRVC